MSSQGSTGEETDWDTVGYLRASEHRQRVLDALVEEGPITPTSLSETVDLSVTHVSRALSSLEDKELVEVLNPNAHKGRLYDSTDTGASINTAVQEVAA